MLIFTFGTLNAQTTKPNEHAQTASGYVQKADFKTAVKHYKKAVQAEPNNLQHQYDLALAYYRLMDYKSTLKYVEPLLTANSPKVEYYRLAGNAHDLSGNKQKGMAVFQSGLKMHPFAGELHLDMGIVELIDGNEFAALRHWENGIAANPKYPDNYYWAGANPCQI